MPSVEERVIDIVAEQLGVAKDQISGDTHFVNDLGADSLDQVELVMRKRHISSGSPFPSMSKLASLNGWSDGSFSL